MYRMPQKEQLNELNEAFDTECNAIIDRYTGDLQGIIAELNTASNDAWHRAEDADDEDQVHVANNGYPEGWDKDFFYADKYSNIKDFYNSYESDDPKKTSLIATLKAMDSNSDTPSVDGDAWEDLDNTVPHIDLG